MFKNILKITALTALVISCFCLITYADEVLLNTTEHNRYMEIENGRFRPNDPLTRSEAARMFYKLLKKQPSSSEMFTDLSDSDCKDEANALGTLGILNGYDGDKFYPQNTLTRAEFAVILKRFFPDEEASEYKSGFSDVLDGFWGIDGILFAAEKGFINGYPDGTFAPEEYISRAETAAIMNKVLLRSGDADVIGYAKNIRIFLDVSRENWAFYEIIEATTSHEYEKNSDGIETWTSWVSETSGLAEGFHTFDGHLYYVNESGQPVRAEDVSAWRFDWNGRYTTWNEELDGYLTDVIKSVTTDDMKKEEKRRALYEYIRDNYRYLKKPLIEKGTVGWQAEYAINFFNERVGNCFSFEAAYGSLLKKVGFEVNFVVGTTGTNNAPHGWVEIIIDDVVYIDDPEIEMSRRVKGNFKTNLYNFTYATAPWPYKK